MLFHSDFKPNLTGCFAATASSTLLRPRLTIVTSVPNARDKYMFFFKMYLNISIYLTGSVYTRVLLENFRAENQEINKRGLTI